MVAILLTLTSIALGGWMLSAIARNWGEQELQVWSAMCVLFVARLVGRGVLLLLPHADAVTKIGVSLPIYLVAIWAVLWLHCRVPPVRALLGAIATTTAVWVLAFAALMMVDPK